MERPRPPFYVPIIFTTVVLIVAILLAPARIFSVFCDSAHRMITRIVLPPQRHLTNIKFMESIKTPVYFFSHGGPNIMYDIGHPVYSQLQKIGKEITLIVKPKAVVVFSAHWQGEPNMVEINTSEDTDLIYDFYGFPANYYKEKFPNKGSKKIAERVTTLLTNAGIKTQGVKRGLDHGVWACFKVAFDTERNPLNIPIVQVSLFDSEDPNQHYRLGQAISALRSENIQIIVSGMAVHNLRDMRFSMMSNEPLPYAISFDEALKEAATAKPEQRQAKMVELLKRSDARKAHPTFEHLLPIFVGAGAADEDKGIRTWTLPEGSISWAQYRFGNLTTAS